MFPIKTAGAGAASFDDSRFVSTKPEAKSRLQVLRELTINTLKATVTKLPDAKDVSNLRIRIDAIKEPKGPSSLSPY